MNFETVSKNLTALGYKVSVFPTAAAAADYLNGQIDGLSVGIGGSVTVQEMGLYDSLSAHNTVCWHWRVPEGSTPDDMRARAQFTDVYLSSVNALAETGEIINIDGSGNRVAATIYGHKKVYLIVGENKLAPDYDAALHRARNVAAPRNAQRLHTDTPCAKNGDKCYDCKSPARICRSLSVFWAAPRGAEYEVLLVGEPLGY